MNSLSLVSLAIAFAAGFVSFASPCVLALVPGYLSFISGVPTDEVESRWRGVIRPTAAFVLGFAVMFALFGASAGLIGRSLARDRDILNIVSGSVLIVMGLAMLLLPRLRMFQSTRRVHLNRRPETLVGAGFVGAAFAAGWTPCIGPILGSILTYAAPTGSPAAGALLLFVYSLGLGIPFLLAGIFMTQTLAASRWIRDRWTVVNAVGASLMIALGILILTGNLERITQSLSGIGFSGL
ncbi:MAG: cytochrome c biogenesis protein CcdA [Thermoleophilia bacterium]|nr:cytochrome c biogenesis protein CcdA [Thermoleophilia bacterium]